MALELKAATGEHQPYGKLNMSRFFTQKMNTTVDRTSTFQPKNISLRN
jgi:hypothetical protein